ncbi:hypothetical protein M9458_017122, partial [Cirrhinus mrigala]
SDEQMDKTPKKEKKNNNKKRVKFALCSSVDAMDSSSAAPEKCDNPPPPPLPPPANADFKNAVILRIRCLLSRLSDNNLSAVSRSSEKKQKTDLLTANQEKEAVKG